MAAGFQEQDFFISYARPNRSWAEWIAVQVERAGFTTVLQAWDFPPGTDFAHEMHRAVLSTRRTIAVLTPAYLHSEFGEAEWRAAFVRDPTGEHGLLLPVRVQPCKPPGLLASRIYVDLVGLSEDGARRRLLAAVADRGRGRPTTAEFPGGRGSARGPDVSGTASPFPGTWPAVNNLPVRRRKTTGRDALLERVYDDLQAHPTRPMVVHGPGGVGKTALALEFAYRFAADYDLIWWITASTPAAVAAQLTALGRELGLLDQEVEKDAAPATLDALRGRDRWLLVYDDAEHPQQLSELLPTGGTGHVLLTSRRPTWGDLASPVPLQRWSRWESRWWPSMPGWHVDNARTVRESGVAATNYLGRRLAGITTAVLLMALGTMATFWLARPDDTRVLGAAGSPHRWALAGTPGDLPGVEVTGIVLAQGDGRIRVSGSLTDTALDGGTVCLHIRAFYGDGGQRDEFDSVREGGTVPIGPAKHYSFSSTVAGIWMREGRGDDDDCTTWAKFHQIW